MSVSRETAIGIGVTTLAVVAMAFDHLDLVGEDFLADPAAFLISSALSVLPAAVVFGFVVPRAKAAPDSTERAARQGIVCSSLAVVPGLLFVWLGVSFVLAGVGIALGLLGRGGEHRRLATAATVVGTIARSQRPDHRHRAVVTTLGTSSLPAHNERARKLGAATGFACGYSRLFAKVSATRLGTTIDHASRTISCISTTSRAARRTTTQL